MAQGLTLNQLTATTFTNQNDLLLIYQTGSTLSISVGNLTKNIVNTNFTGGTLTITGNTTIIGNSNSDMLRVTQTGSGNAFVVEDSSNPDLTPFVITSGGTVGIGVTNPNPFTLNQADGKLHVRSGSSGVTGGTGGSTVVIEASTTNYLSMYSPDENVSGIVFGSNSDAFGSFIRWGRDQGKLQIATANTNDYIEFGAGENLFNTYITTTGFGVNTLPTRTLTVSGNSNFIGNIDSTGIIFCTNVIANESLQGNEIFPSEDVDLNISTRTDTGTKDINLMTGPKPGGLGYIRMTITSGGTVGVGTTTPTHTFHVSGNSNPVRFEGLVSNTGATKTVIADNNGVLYVENKPKKYVALLTQSSTSAPTAIVLENTLGSVTFGYVSTGTYSITATGLLTSNKTTIVTGGAVCSTSNLTIDGFYLLSYNIPNPSNGILSNSTLEITVYP
jgi:hypothetical protein